MRAPLPLCAAIFCALPLPSCSAAGPALPDTTASAVSPATAAPPPTKPALFEFRSGFWLNVHQRLHYGATGRRPPPADAPLPVDDPAWIAALAFYKQRFAGKGAMGLIFDDELVALNRHLSALASAPVLTGVDPEIARHLTAAGDLVRADWDAQDRANQAWIDALEPLVARHGEALKGELSAIFQTPWQDRPIRVDVSGFGGPVGAYTVTPPPHITVSRADPGYAGDAALEMIFHESAHALSGLLVQRIAAEAARRGREAPRDLWHAVLFYSVGEVVKRHLGPSYVPYATRNGLWTRGDWGPFEVALRRRWPAYLEGKVDLDAAIREVFDDLPPEPPD